MIRRTTKLFLELLAIVSAGLTILLVLAAVKLSSGPLPVGFVTPFIVGALEPEDGSLDVDVDETVLTWGGWDRALQLRAVGVKVTDPSGDVRADIPELTIGLSGRALLRGELAPTSLEVVGPRLVLLRTEDGAIRFADEPRPSAEEQEAAVAPEDEESRPRVTGDLASRLLADLLAPPGPANKMGYLTSLSILDADLTLDDRKLGMQWRSPSATFVFLKGGTGLRLEGAFGFDIGGEPAEFVLSADYNTQYEEISADLQLADIQPALFAARVPLFAAFAGFKLPLSGTLRVRAGFDGTVQDVTLNLVGGAGTVALPGAPDEAAVPVRSLRLRSRVTRDLTVALLDEVTADLGGPQLTMTGSIQGVSQGVVTGPFELAAELAVRNVSLADLKRLWPAQAAPNAHRWVSANMNDGLVQEGRFALTGTAGEEGLADFGITDLSGGFRYSGVSVSYFAPLPPIHKAHGSAKVSSDALTFAVAGGEVQGLQIGASTVHITGLDVKDQDLAVEAIVRGSARQVLTILDSPRLGYAKELGVNPAEVGGETAVRLVLRLPLIDALTFKQVEIAAAATLRGITLPKPAFDLDLSAGDFILQLDGRGMDVTGTAMLGDIPINLTWWENFAPKDFSRRFKIVTTVDATARRSIGLDVGEYVQGPVSLDATMTQFPSRTNTLAVTADLTQAVLDVSEIAWRKEAGVRGVLKADIALTGEQPTAIRSFVLDGEGFLANGAATLTGDGKGVSSVKLAQLIYGRSDVAVDISRRADNGFDIALKGRAFDASGLLRGGDKDQPLPPQRGGDTDATYVPLGIAVTLERLYLSDTGALTNVSARLQRDTQRWRTIMIDGQPSDGKYVSVNLAPDGGNRRLQARSDDAGNLFKALGISENIVGGNLQLNGQFDDSTPDSPLTGKLEVEDFRLINAPVIAKLLSVALLTGILDSLRGEGIGFSRMDVPFTLKKDVIETRSAKAHGSAIGFTAEGWVNLRNDTLGLRGTIVPAYAVNSILGNIPLIGKLLGPEGSGVFAATYRMTGSLDDPDIAVNPLATLAPGFLRGLFGIFEGGVPPNPDAVPDPSREREAPLPVPSSRD